MGQDARSLASGFGSFGDFGTFGNFGTCWVLTIRRVLSGQCLYKVQGFYARVSHHTRLLCRRRRTSSSVFVFEGGDHACALMFLSTIAKDHTHVQQKHSSIASTV